MFTHLQLCSPAAASASPTAGLALLDILLRQPQNLDQLVSSREAIGAPQEAIDKVGYVVTSRLRRRVSRLHGRTADNIVRTANCRCFAPTQPSRCLRPHVLRSAGRAPHPEYSRAEPLELGRLQRESSEDQCAQSWASHDYRGHVQTYPDSSSRYSRLVAAPCNFMPAFEVSVERKL